MGKYQNLAIVCANKSHYLCTCKHNANICDIMQQYFRISAVLSVFIMAALATAQAHRHHSHGEVAGKVVAADASDVYATVVLKGTPHGSPTAADGTYSIKAPAGQYTLEVSAMGYRKALRKVEIRPGKRLSVDVRLTPSAIALAGVQVVSSGIDRVKGSAYNAVAIDARPLHNSTKTLAEALQKAPGLKLREAGGVGSDMNVSIDGFSGKHVKVFIDGVPQEGVGSSFGLNNIPVSFAERIEVYKGVVPVGLGADAIGGVINIVTDKRPRRWHADASYSYGSFNTHKSHVNFGQAFSNGLTYEVNAFQNYSDNDYRVDAPVYNFETNSMNTKKLENVRRFNDTYHNEAVIAKVGVTGKPWADRLMLGFGYSHVYKEIQTGVRQKTVFGEKHRHGHSLMPSLEYSKRDLFVKGLSAVATVNYNRNSTTNVDTASYDYNWRGERRRKSGQGEQSLLHSRADNDNWNSTLTLTYRPAHGHTLTFSNVFNAMKRTNTSLLYGREETNPIDKQTRKNIAGLSYRLMPTDRWNVAAFAKYYRLYAAGPVATDENASDFVSRSRTLSSWGYGAAASLRLLPGLQAKLSYEKAYRLPTTEEMFGDEDLETGSTMIRPENSHNVNLSLSYRLKAGRHALYAEGGLIYRDTRDYIQRAIAELSGNREGAFYENYGRVRTTGGNLSVRYSFGPWLSVGGSFTQMDVKDNERLMVGSQSVPNPVYRSRMPNVPYRFADSDVTLTWPGLGGEGNTLSLTYDNQYTHSFSYYSEGVQASNRHEFMVPTQFAHNLSATYSIARGRYNISLECRNFTDEKLYDNFSLQKAGRAFYAKVRVSFGG